MEMNNLGYSPLVTKITNDIPAQQPPNENSQSIRNIDARDNLYITQENNQHKLRSKVEKLIAQGRKVRINKTVEFNSFKHDVSLFIQKTLNFFNDNVRLVDDIPDVIDLIEYKSKGKFFDLNGRIDQFKQLKSKLYNLMPPDRTSTLVCYQLSYIVASDMVKITGHSSKKDLADEIIEKTPDFESLKTEMETYGIRAFMNAGLMGVNRILHGYKEYAKGYLEELVKYLSEFGGYNRPARLMSNLLASKDDEFDDEECKRIIKSCNTASTIHRLAL